MFLQKTCKTRCFCSPGRSRPRKIRCFSTSATKRSQSAPTASLEHTQELARAQKIVFYDAFHVSDNKNTAFYVFLCVPGRFLGVSRAPPELPRAYLSTPDRSKSDPRALAERPQCIPALPRASQAVSKAPRSIPRVPQSSPEPCRAVPRASTCDTKCEMSKHSTMIRATRSRSTDRQTEQT